MTQSASRRTQKRYGFTLTEIAIVLGVMGLVLAAIWTAAATVYDNWRVTKADRQLMTVVTNVRSLYINASQVDPTADMFVSGANTGARTLYLRTGIFPSDTLDTGNPSTATQAYNPWGENISVFSDPPKGFAVSFGITSASACIKLISSVLNAGQAGLYDIHYQAVPVWAGDFYPQTGPVSITNITNACQNFPTSVNWVGPNAQFVMFHFSLN